MAKDFHPDYKIPMVISTIMVLIIPSLAIIMDVILGIYSFQDNSLVIVLIPSLMSLIYFTIKNNKKIIEENSIVGHENILPKIDDVMQSPDDEVKIYFDNYDKKNYLFGKYPIDDSDYKVEKTNTEEDD